jgi:hypothetical protein
MAGEIARRDRPERSPGEIARRDRPERSPGEIARRDRMDRASLFLTFPPSHFLFVSMALWLCG